MVLIKGSLCARSGSGYDFTFWIEKQDGEDQVGSRFFPSVFWNIVFDQTNQDLQVSTINP